MVTEDLGRILVCWYGLKLMREENSRPGVAAVHPLVTQVCSMDHATYRAADPAPPLARARL